MLIGYAREIWRYPVKSMAGERLSTCTIGSRGVVGDRGWALRDETAGEIRGAKYLPQLLQCSARYRSAPGGATPPDVEIRFPDGTQVSSDDPDVAARLSAFLGRRVSLWRVQPAARRSHYKRAQAGGALLAWMSRTRRLRPHVARVIRLAGQEREARAVFGREADEPLPDFSAFPPELFEFTSPPGTYFDAFPIHLLTTASLETMMRNTPAADWNVRRFRPNVLIATPPGAAGLVEASWGHRTVRLGEVALRCEGPTVRCAMTMHAQEGLPRDPAILRTIVREADQQLGAYASPLAGGVIAEGAAATLE
jgi:uncharacterized protein YcbX